MASVDSTAVPASDHHIFFDAADTIFKLAEPVEKTYVRFAEQHGWKIGENEIREAFVDTWSRLRHDTPPYELFSTGNEAELAWWLDFVKDVFNQASKSPGTVVGDDVAMWFPSLFDYFAQPSAWHMFSDTRPALKLMKDAGFNLHILSNFDQRLHAIIGDSGIIDFFTTITLSSDSKARKPDPRAFDHAWKMAGSPPKDHCYQIGNHFETDVNAARKAGFKAVLVERDVGIDLVTISETLASHAQRD